eukprot:scaffold1401_cov330-Pavlova_lutheri.AAC.109
MREPCLRSFPRAGGAHRVCCPVPDPQSLDFSACVVVVESFSLVPWLPWFGFLHSPPRNGWLVGSRLSPPIAISSPSIDTFRLDIDISPNG